MRFFTKYLFRITLVTIVIGSWHSGQAMKPTQIGLSEMSDDYGDATKPLLFRAAEKGNYNMTYQLLRLGVNPDVLGPHKQTPLMAAINNYHRKIVTLLLAYGASPEAADDSGRDVLFYAQASGNLMIVTTILTALTARL
jgi:hypothetical protein